MKEIKLNLIQFIVIIFGVIVLTSLVIIEIVRYYDTDIIVAEEETNNILDKSENAELYEKYADKNPIWYIRDYLDIEEDFATGAFSKSMDLFKKDELEIVDGVLYWITDTNNGPDERVKARSIEGVVKYLILPNKISKSTSINNTFYVLTEDGVAWRCYPTSSYRELDRPDTPFEKIVLDDKVIDMCYINEKDPAFSNLYFLLANGKLVHYQHSNSVREYENLSEDFFDKFENDATTDVFDYITVKHLYYNDKSYIKVSVGENKFGEEEKEFLYLGCDEKIDKVLVDRIAVGEYAGEIGDIYFLTKNGNVYSYPFGYVYDYKENTLFKVGSGVAKVEENKNGFVAYGDDGKKIELENLYADGE